MPDLDTLCQTGKTGAVLQLPSKTTRAVLFVDDDENILAALKRALRSEPYRVECSASGPEAMKILRQKEFQVIVTDMSMPQMDGLSLLNAVAAQYPEMLRLILSARSDYSAQFHHQAFRQRHGVGAGQCQDHGRGLFRADICGLRRGERYHF